MLSLFQRKRAPPADSTVPAPDAEAPKGMIRPERAATLLATPRRARLLEHIWQRTSLSRQQFAVLYLAPLQRYAELVQQFPASEAHHHAYPGGMLDHGLEIVAYALKLRQSHLLPAGAMPEDQVAQAEAWTAVVAYAALLYDLGKIAVDLHVECADGSLWHPWHGPLTQAYRFRYRKDREYRLHSAATGLIHHQILSPSILDWLSRYPSLWSPLLYVLAGQYEHAGVLGELVTQADKASVAQELGGDPAKAMAAPKHALQRKLLDGLRYLLKSELKLNQAGPADGWLTQDALWLVSKTVSDKLRAHLLAQGIDGIPANNTAVFNVLQDHGMLQPTPDGKAIWRATIASENGWSHSFTLLRLTPALIWESAQRPEPFAGTVTIDTAQDSNEAQPAPAGVAVPVPVDDAIVSPEGAAIVSQESNPLPDVMADMLAMIAAAPRATVHENTVADVSRPKESRKPPVSIPSPVPAPIESAAFTPESSGEHFVAWLKQAIVSRRLIINDAKALLHTVDNTAYLVTPGVFQRYAQEHPRVSALAKQEKQQDWRWVQKRFEKLGLHRKHPNGLNIWTCEVAGLRKTRRLHGHLLLEPGLLFETVPPNNPYLSILTESPAPRRPDSTA
jgi:integrating conjugative element relaxase (TIGR03760 family)